ncbi:MAG: SRPBCC family protein [Pirellulales bacterium]|nr:SRPBCC family protein [Pirellulales bacterium]
MKLHDRIHVNAPPFSVWEVISDPNLMELWNPKCTRSDAGRGPFGVGNRYEAAFRMGRKPEQVAECVIEEYEPERLLTTKYSGGNAFKPEGFVRESYRLVPKRGGTRVCQTIDFTHSGIPLWAQLFMKIINCVGYSVGKGPLDGIKKLAEQAEGHLSSKRQV